VQERLRGTAQHHKVNLLNVSGRDGSGESETKHWLEMLANPNITVVQWHRLKAETRSQGRKEVHWFHILTVPPSVAPVPPTLNFIWQIHSEEINIYCRNLRLANSMRIHQLWIFNFWTWEGAICNHLHILLMHVCYWAYISTAYIMQKSIVPYLCTLFCNYYNLISMGHAEKVIWDNKVK